ncbi:hypothetical protein PCI56_26700 [Plesiomonas shigelloides subsp. oncorhynchi]|nr:hypothetical protein [Plesiomonas shigelloides]
MLLGLVTGQRLGDLLNMKYSDIKDGYLHVVQQKTGMKIAISTNLYNEALKLSLQDVIDMTRDNRGSEYIIHTYYSTSQTKAGSAIKNATTLSTAFGKLRDQCGIDWENRHLPVSTKFVHCRNVYTESKVLTHRNC